MLYFSKFLLLIPNSKRGLDKLLSVFLVPYFAGRGPREAKNQGMGKFKEHLFERILHSIFYVGIILLSQICYAQI